MRSNFKAICTASVKWQSEFEGVLSVKDKKNNYSEHWCRLKGNLLVFFKIPDRLCEEIFGIIILEYFTIETLSDNNNQNSFRLVFRSGDPSITLVAKSKEEYYSWKQHISEARCNSFTQKIQALKEEVNLLQKQITDSDSALKDVDFVDEGADNGDKSGLEITLSCERLPHYAIETLPNPSVSVYIRNSYSKEERVHSNTEIVHNSQHPVFHKVVFIPETLYDPNINVKFAVFDVRDIRSNTRHKIGAVEVNINILLQNSNLMLNFKDNYNRDMESLLRIQVQEYQSKNFRSETIPEMRSYQMVAENNLIKSYNFPRTEKKSIRICEMMGESKFGLSVSTEYLKKLFAEESLLQESLSRFGSSDTQLEKMRTDRHIAIRDNMSKYENILNYMSQLCAEDKKFHPSCKKREFLSSFVPVNLHINRILIADDTTNEMINHLDIISVGAFTAHCLKFRNGGLLQMAKNNPETQDKNSAANTANLMIRHYVQLVQHFSDQLKHLSSYTTIPNDIKEDLDLLDVKMNKFTKFFHHQYFMSLSLEQIKKDYCQLTAKMKDFIDNHDSSETNIKIIQACADKFKQSIDSISIFVINILWPKILYSFNESMNLDWAEFALRENMTMSQALTAVITGVALACNTWTPVQWSQMAICGIPLYFEGLLTSYGDEISMIEDMKWVIDKLSDITVIIKPDLKAPTFNFISLKRIEITCFYESWKNAPMEIRMKKQCVFHLHPFFFNVGINEQQTLADKISKTSLLQTVNMGGYTSMKAYFDRHVKNIGNSIQTCLGAEIIDSLNDLQYEIQKNRNKPVKILRIAERISWAWGAIRFTSCKSAKDRTGMGISLEQVRWLKNVGGMQKEYFTKALECIRSTGLRRDNCYKNIRSNKYAFNAFQLLSFPKSYKAPVGTYGSNES